MTEEGSDGNPEDLLNISGHEDRTPPGELDDPFGIDEDSEAGADADDELTDPDEFYAGDADDLDEVLDDGEDDEETEVTTDETDAIDDVLPDDDAVDEADDGEVEPVELLVQLAKRGDIDPWDIDIVRVTDEFLDALEEVDLRTSGRALFYASVLLRMKGDELIHGSDDNEEDTLEPWEQPFDDEPPENPDPNFDPVEGLEEEMERRLDRKQARGTPETLDELVRDLRDAERGTWWKQRREYDTSQSPQGFQRGTQTLDYHAGDDFRAGDEPTEDEVTGTTHEEDIEEIIDDVRAALSDHYDAGRAEVLYAEIDVVGGTRVQTFLALLFLAHRGQVKLQQDELFGDLWVQDPSAARVSEEAIAD
ncbi:segregation/condensation protein A [Haloarchaeobius sp. DFWS5]|uniref:segregation/condensation protein A n=1 Tax=Haloarchaeobius sp. DFWS5 TaxID=3446114 RepID=UPI003EC0AC32